MILHHRSMKAGECDTCLPWRAESSSPENMTQRSSLGFHEISARTWLDKKFAWRTRCSPCVSSINS